MLDKNNIRQLAYVVIIDNILPIEGADRVEQAVVGGWHIMTRKGQFKPGDPAIYFEIDSKVPETEPFKFLEPKHYKVKTQKYFKGTVISQGLLMSAEDFGWKVNYGRVDLDKVIPYITDDENNNHFPDDETRFLTEKLGVKYAVDEDNERKAASADKYKKMAQRHGKLFSHQPFRWLMKRKWGRKLLFIFFGKKKDKRSWPEWVVKTDEERIQNMPWILEDKEPWIATEKIDGTSTTFTLKRKSRKQYEFLVCSRNVCFDKPDKNCYYETNVYTEMAKKYDIESKMIKMMEDFFTDSDWLTIQGETYGPGIQKRDYSAPEHAFMAFNLISSKEGRWNTEFMKNMLEKVYGIPCVPIVNNNFILPDTVDELLEYATGESALDGGMREGIVFRYKDGSKSFKAVSNKYLLKYHS